MSVPLPESETADVVPPVATPEPFNVNEPVAPANDPVPPVIVIEPVPVVDPPICGIKTPAGIEKVPTNTAPLGKIIVNVPEIGPVFTPDNVAWLRFPAADIIAFPKVPTEPFPIMEKLVAVTRAPFPDSAIVVGVLCPKHRPVARNKIPATLEHPRFILLTWTPRETVPSMLASQVGVYSTRLRPRQSPTRQRGDDPLASPPCEARPLGNALSLEEREDMVGWHFTTNARARFGS
jgi:hypothetical protein